MFIFLSRILPSLTERRCFVERKVFRFRERETSEENGGWKIYQRRELESSVPFGIVNFIVAGKIDQGNDSMNLIRFLKTLNFPAFVLLAVSPKGFEVKAFISKRHVLVQENFKLE